MIQIQRLKHLSSGTLQSLKTGEFPKEMEDRREEYVEMFKERMYEWWTEGTSSKESGRSKTPPVAENNRDEGESSVWSVEKPETTRNHGIQLLGNIYRKMRRLTKIHR